jgi:hypothetical protein
MRKGCLVTAALANHLSPLRLLGWLPPSCYAVMFVLRRANRPPTDFVDPAPYQRWRRRHWMLIHVGCLLWGVVSVYFGYRERDDSLPFIVTVLISVTLGAALSQAFSMDARQTALTLVLLYLPSITGHQLPRNQTSSVGRSRSCARENGAPVSSTRVPVGSGSPTPAEGDEGGSA